MTIVEAIKQVMLEAGKALSPQEAYEGILSKRLYTFNAENPVHVVRSQIRRHCKGLEFPSSAPSKHFGNYSAYFRGVGILPAFRAGPCSNNGFE